ncbi:phage portal protein [Thioclava sp. GXIMD4216]|uniref:phage portal protein n=1 Tax=Thioclava sp. GXIMD4216 TaxID=3131929 RepID=UPI0030CE9CDC
MPAVTAAIRIISEAAASLDVAVKTVGEDGAETALAWHPSAAFVSGEANGWTSSYELIRDLVIDALSDDRGGLAFVNRSGDGRILEIIRPRAGVMQVTDRLSAYMATVPKRGLTVVCNQNGGPASYRSVADEMRDVKDAMKHPDAKTYVTHGLRKNATIELYLAGCDDEMVKAITGHSGVEMLKKYGGQERQKVLAMKAQEARNRAWTEQAQNTNVSKLVSKNQERKNSNDASH